MEMILIQKQEVMKIIFYSRKKKNYVKNKLALLTINQELANTVNRNKALLMAFDLKSLYLSANVDKDSYYHRIETGYQFTPNKELELIRQFNNRTFTQFKDQASASLKVRYHCPKNLIFQHLPVKKMLFWMENYIKILIGYEMDK